MSYYSNIAVVMEEKEYKGFLEGGKTRREFDKFIECAGINKTIKDFPMYMQGEQKSINLHMMVWRDLDLYPCSFGDCIQYLNEFREAHTVDFIQIGGEFDDIVNECELDTGLIVVERGIGVDEWNV